MFAFFGSRGLYGLDLNGEVQWQMDLGDMRTKHAHGEGSSPALHGDNVYASPVAAAGRVYITDLDGTTLVISDAEAPEVLALNHLDDSFSASAAIVGRELILRGERHLYLIAEE